MKKWSVILSTTEPENYIGIIKVRQGNKNTEVLQAIITENGSAIDLTGYEVSFQAVIGERYPVERHAKVINPKAGLVEYTFDDRTMQVLGKQTANFAIKNGDDIIGTSQDFSYFVINAVSKTPGEMGTYWQSAEDLLNDMTSYLNAGKGDFRSWFDSVKDILESIDPGGLLLSEVVSLKKVIYKQVPSGFTFVIEHDSEYQPDIKVTSYQQAIGTEPSGLDTGTSFGGTRIYNVPTSLSYDRKRVYIEMPILWAMNGEILIHDNNLVMINGSNILSFVANDVTITSGHVQEINVPKELTVTVLNGTTAKLTWENGDSTNDN